MKLGKIIGETVIVPSALTDEIDDPSASPNAEPRQEHQDRRPLVTLLVGGSRQARGVLRDE